MANIKYRIGFGADEIGVAYGNSTDFNNPFTADSTLIYTDTTIRHADETN